MTQQQLPAVDVPYFDFDIERDDKWKMPEPRAWNSVKPKPTLWERLDAWLDAVLEPFEGTGVDD
jgi:hypothetical protein